MLGKCRQCEREFSYVHKQKDRVVCDTCKAKNKYFNRRPKRQCVYCFRFLPLHKHKYCKEKCRKYQEQLLRSRIKVDHLVRRRTRIRGYTKGLKAIWREKNREKTREYSKRDYYKHREARLAKQKRLREKKRLNMQVVV